MENYKKKMVYNPDVIAAQIGLHVQMARRAAGMTQKELAEKTGYSQTTIINTELGRRTSFNIGLLSDVAAACGVDWRAFFRFSENEEKMWRVEQ